MAAENGRRPPTPFSGRQRKRPRFAAPVPMARPGLEQGTPRFPASGNASVFRTRIPANQREATKCPFARLGPNMRGFCGLLGDETYFVAQSTWYGRSSSAIASRQRQLPATPPHKMALVSPAIAKAPWRTDFPPDVSSACHGAWAGSTWRNSRASQLGQVVVSRFG
jgi:hypothetical protein